MRKTRKADKQNAARMERNNQSSILKSKRKMAKQQPAQYVVTSGQSFISAMPATGMKIRNQEKGVEWAVEPTADGGLKITRKIGVNDAMPAQFIL